MCDCANHTQPVRVIRTGSSKSKPIIMKTVQDRKVEPLKVQAPKPLESKTLPISTTKQFTGVRKARSS